METSVIEWVSPAGSNEYFGKFGDWVAYIGFDRVMNEYCYTLRHGRASYVTGSNRDIEWVKNQCEFYAQNF